MTRRDDQQRGSEEPIASSAERPIDGDRRRFLIGSGALAAIAALPLGIGGSGCGDDDASGACASPLADDGAQVVSLDADAIIEDSARFPLSLQLGALHATRALVVGFGERSVLGDETLSLKIWHEQADVPVGQVKMLLDRPITLSEGGYFRAPIDGLTAGRRYRYALFSERGGQLVARTPVGRFRACLPETCTEPVTLAPTSCTSMKRAPFPALTRLAQEPVDAFCHLGDMSYNDGARTLEEYRLKWRRTLGEQGYRDILPAAPIYCTLDDHELINDDKLYGLPPAQREAALDAWFEHAAIPDLGDRRIWTSYRWGRSVEVFVLDCRNERRPETIDTDDPIYISKEQLAWLKETVPASPCHFKVLLNSVPIIDFPGGWSIQLQDRWQGYGKQREELLAALDEVDNVWWLSGDFHIGLVARLEAAGRRRKVWEILGGPGGNDSDIWRGLASNPLVLERLAPPDQFDFFGVEPSATWVTFDPRADEVRVRFVEGVSGEVVYDRILSQRDDPRDAA